MQEPQETQVPSLGQGDPVEQGMATHSGSCQDNPMDRGPWWAIVQWVTKSRTWTEHTYPSSACWKLQMNNVLSFPPCDFNVPKSVHELVEWFRAMRDVPDPVPLYPVSASLSFLPCGPLLSFKSANLLFASRSLHSWSPPSGMLSLKLNLWLISSYPSEFSANVASSGKAPRSPWVKSGPGCAWSHHLVCFFLRKHIKL